MKILKDKVFYVERDIIRDWSSNRKIDLSGEKSDKMLLFAELIYKANRRFNITGLKTREEILTGLILKSLDPICDIIVPRGTRFADMGSGAGIPGIALAVYFDYISGILIESNNKKAGFIGSAINELELGGLEVICSRAELLARDAVYRERFDWCFARAFGKIYIAVEAGAPFLKRDGILYIYSNLKPEDLPAEVTGLTGKVGLDIMSHEERVNITISGTGLCFRKARNTPDKYPRKFAVIKREAEKNKTVNGGNYDP